MTHRHKWVKGAGPTGAPHAFGCYCGQWTANPERFPMQPMPSVDRAAKVRVQERGSRQTDG